MRASNQFPSNAIKKLSKIWFQRALFGPTNKIRDAKFHTKGLKNFQKYIFYFPVENSKPTANTSDLLRNFSM